MAQPTEYRGDEIHYGSVIFAGLVTFPAGTITNAMVSAAAAIGAEKIIHQYAVHYQQAGGGDVASATVIVHVAKGAGLLVAVRIVPIVAPTGGDKAFTVDVKKGNAAGAYATVLTGVETIDSSVADREVVSATIDGTKDDYSAADSFTVVIAASGSTGSQGQGVLVELFFQEAPSA